MEKEKPGMMLYWSTFDVLDTLLDGQAKVMLRAMREYSQYSVIPDFGNDAVLRTLWMLVKPLVDADSERYKKNRKENQIKGWKSDFKRNYAPLHGIDPNDEKELQKYLDMRRTEQDNNS